MFFKADKYTLVLVRFQFFMIIFTQSNKLLHINIIIDMVLESILADSYQIHFNEKGFDFLNELLKEKKYSKVFILTDSNTNAYCLPVLLADIVGDYPFEIIEIEAGEEYKNLETCQQVWMALSDLGGDRKSVLLNLGGGVVTDLGGFVAATYMRGIDFVNIPTSLLAMVDASVGGKTGVDLGNLKNQIGVISNPLGVIIDSRFLATLPAQELRSGMAEMFKHGLIQSVSYWEKMRNLKDLDISDLDSLIYDSVIIKNNIVKQDPTEKGLRKTLNFGHTLGHAIESYFLSAPDRERLLHGEAIAIGMVLAVYLSYRICGLSRATLEEVKLVLEEYFPKVNIHNQEITEILNLLRFDKKNSHGKVNFVLLQTVATPKIDCNVEENVVLDAFEYYNR